MASDIRLARPEKAAGKLVKALLISKVDAAQNDAGRGALELPGKEFARRALLDPVAQPQELQFALVQRCPRSAVQVVHRRGADGARDFPGAVLHGKQHHHAVELETTDTAAFERHLFLAGWG